MRYTRADVVNRALQLVDEYGLADLTMRRLATDLAVAPSALYWHVRNKQELLAAVADEILDRGDSPGPDESPSTDLGRHCHQLRNSLLSYRDGAEVVATAHAFRLGARDPIVDLTRTARQVRATEPDAVGAALGYFLLGFVIDEQTSRQAEAAGQPGLQRAPESEFEAGLGIILAGVTSTSAIRSGQT